MSRTKSLSMSLSEMILIYKKSQIVIASTKTHRANKLTEKRSRQPDPDPSVVIWTRQRLGIDPQATVSKFVN